MIGVAFKRPVLFLRSHDSYTPDNSMDRHSTGSAICGFVRAVATKFGPSRGDIKATFAIVRNRFFFLEFTQCSFGPAG